MKRVGSMMVLAAVALAGCGSDDGVTVDNAWSRASAPTQTQAVAYFDLTVPEDDTLIAASVPASVAAGAEIHEVIMDEGVAMDDMPPDLVDDDMELTMDQVMDEMEMSEGSHDMTDADNGAVRMQQMPAGLALTGGQTVPFEPGSYHIMMPGLVEPLTVGDDFELTLEFANADDVTVTIEVAETAP